MLFNNMYEYLINNTLNTLKSNNLPLCKIMKICEYFILLKFITNELIFLFSKGQIQNPYKIKPFHK